MDRPSPSENYDCESCTPKKSLIVFSLGRTGSSWLTIGMYKVGLGIPMEYFHLEKMENMYKRWKNTSDFAFTEDTLAEYINLLYTNRTTKNGVWSSKIHINQWRALYKKIYSTEDVMQLCTDLKEKFINPHFVFLYREDILLQAISFYIAIETNSWSSEYAEKNTVEYNFASLKSLLVEVVTQVQRCRLIQQNMDAPKIELHYEELERNYNGSLQKVADLLGEKIEITDEIEFSGIQKQGTERNLRWKKRFLADLEASS